MVPSGSRTVAVTVAKPDLYGSNLLRNGSGELGPLTRYYWVEESGKWTQNNSAVDGMYTITASDGEVAELSQVVDVSAYSKDINAGKQSFKTSAVAATRRGNLKLLVEFLDANKKVLLSKELSQGKAGKKVVMKPYESVQLAPSGTSSIRVRLISDTKPKRSRHAQFDRVELIAVTPKQ